MGNKPLLSVIVPVYNTSKYLPRCLDSLLRQTYESLEIILVDDGSKDDSPGICDACAKDHPNIRVIHKENAGLGYARNSGLDTASGEWVAFCDSDDYIDRQMYSLLMAETETADAVFCDLIIHKKNGELQPAQSLIPEGQYTGRELLLHMLGASPESKRDFSFDMSVCKAVYSKRLIESCDIRFTSERTVICEDLFFHIDFLSRAENVRYMQKNLYYYCENEGSLTHRHIADRLAKEKRMYLALDQAAKEQYGDKSLYWKRLFLGRVRITMAQSVYYTQGYTFRQKINEIRAIANDTLVRSVIGNYPLNRNPAKLRVFNLCLKCRFSLGMYLLLVLNR